jgi:hypothetical protein
MHIVIGNTYFVEPQFKKSFVETQRWENAEGDKLTQEIGWRWGSAFITPENETEVKLLEAASQGEMLTFSDFENWELIECWDGCWEDWESVDVDIDNLQEEFEASENSEESWFDEWLREEMNYDNDDCVFDIIGGINISETEDNDIV